MRVLHCREAQCFVQLLNLLNTDFSPEAGSQLCERVLSTLTSLLAGNEASRKKLQQDVGYDTLLSIVLRRTAPTGPCAGVLMQLLHLILEVTCHNIYLLSNVLHATSSEMHWPMCLFKCCNLYSK